MKNWLILAVAIVLEVAATLALRAAIDQPWWAILTVAGYAGAFVALSLLLRRGAKIGIVYGIGRHPVSSSPPLPRRSCSTSRSP